MANASIPIRFQIYKGDQLVREEVLSEPVIKIGKLASSHLRLEDETVSRMHAVVEVTGPGQLQLIDLGFDARHHGERRADKQGAAEVR